MNIILSSEAKAMRKLRERRKQNGDCTRCGHKLPANHQYLSCPDYMAYANENRIHRFITGDELGFLQFRK